MTVEIYFNQQVDPSIQVNDVAWVCTVSNNEPVIATGPSSRVGVIIDVQSNFVVVEVEGGVAPNPGQFFLFSKPIAVNESGLKGYYADVTFRNSSKTYAELFAIGSEAVISSK